MIVLNKVIEPHKPDSLSLCYGKATSSLSIIFLIYKMGIISILETFYWKSPC